MVGCDAARCREEAGDTAHCKSCRGNNSAPKAHEPDSFFVIYLRDGLAVADPFGSYRGLPSLCVRPHGSDAGCIVGPARNCSLAVSRQRPSETEACCAHPAGPREALPPLTPATV